jgi:hypothetical protein
MLTVEFTIEPFVEGDPGVHVTAAVAAVEAHMAMAQLLSTFQFHALTHESHRARFADQNN